MPDAGPPLHRRLPRLAPEWYRGRAWVLWTLTLDDRATGWLDALHHARLRELLVHALARHNLACPAYCAMPDHLHLLWAGLGPTSDQRPAMRLLRTAWNAELRLRGFRLQRQAHDHVLRDHERTRGAVASAAHYIWENPVRGNLVAAWGAYGFSGAVVPGYPGLDPRDDAFWDVFWRVYADGEADASKAAREGADEA